VLHIVATGDRRGGEIFASDLVGALVGLGVDQHIAVLRGSSVEAPFEAPISMLQGNGGGPSILNVDVGTVRRLRNLVSAWGPDVFQVHGGEALKVAASASIGMRIPIVYRRIGLAPAWLDRGPRRVGYGFLMRRAARVVAVAEPVRRETIRRFRVPPSRVVRVPNAVDPRRIAPSRGRDEVRRSLGIPASSSLLVSVGTISWEKDPLTHLRITSRILRERDVVLVWVGDGPMRARLRSEADRTGLDGRVLLVGQRSDVADLLGAADIALFASRTDGMEGMPAAVIEAGMAGIPVAGFSVAGVSEVVLDGRTGILVDPGDIEGVAVRVSALLADDERRTAMGRAARDRCIDRFTIGPVARRYLSLYEEVAGA
jgi:glycosyltransferase involved in cell wall biosynthesis